LSALQTGFPHSVEESLPRIRDVSLLSVCPGRHVGSRGAHDPFRAPSKRAKYHGLRPTVNSGWLPAVAPFPRLAPVMSATWFADTWFAEMGASAYSSVASIRRLSCRPSGVSLVAMGCSEP